MPITFDGPTKLAILSAGTTELDVADLYSRWKDWVAAGNAQYLEMFRPVGGEPIDPGAGTSIPLYAFLVNGWRVRPQEAGHTLAVGGGVLLVDGGGDPFVNTLGSFIVRVSYQQPVQAITVATAGGGGASPADIAAAVLAAMNTTPPGVDVKKMNGAAVIGTGTVGDGWRGVGVSP
jgi:hypothetical protein